MYYLVALNVSSYKDDPLLSECLHIQLGNCGDASLTMSHWCSLIDVNTQEQLNNLKDMAESFSEKGSKLAIIAVPVDESAIASKNVADFLGLYRKKHPD